MSRIRTDLKTDRLEMRRFSLRDAERVTALCGNWRVSRYLARVPHPYRMKDAEDWIATLPAAWEAGLNFTFAILYNRQLIGCMGLHAEAEKDEAGGTIYELGYWLGQEAWGQGFATEAGRAVLGFARDDLGLSRLTATHHIENSGSAHVLAKLGFGEVGREQVWSISRRAFMPAVRVKLDFTAGPFRAAARPVQGSDA